MKGNCILFRYTTWYCNINSILVMAREQTPRSATVYHNKSGRAFVRFIWASRLPHYAHAIHPETSCQFMSFMGIYELTKILWYCDCLKLYGNISFNLMWQYNLISVFVFMYILWLTIIFIFMIILCFNATSITMMNLSQYAIAHGVIFLVISWYKYII